MCTNGVHIRLGWAPGFGGRKWVLRVRDWPGVWFLVENWPIFRQAALTDVRQFTRRIICYDFFSTVDLQDRGLIFEPAPPKFRVPNPDWLPDSEWQPSPGVLVYIQDLHERTATATLGGFNRARGNLCAKFRKIPWAT